MQKCRFSQDEAQISIKRETRKQKLIACDLSDRIFTVNFLNFQMSEIFAVITVKFKPIGLTAIANSEDPDQTALGAV